MHSASFFLISPFPDFHFLSGEDEDQYEQFMLPLTAAFETVAQMFSTNTFNEQEAKVSWAEPSLLPIFSLLFPSEALTFSVQADVREQVTHPERVPFSLLNETSRYWRDGGFPVSV